MNSKIIFWINDDLSSLGLSKILQEKYNFDIYAILDIADKKKKFFQKQQLIKFSKIWFFHDHIQKSKSPDIGFLKSFEEKYKVNLWLLAYNERFFNDFNQFYKFSTNEILSILEQECKLFEKILDEIRPTFLLTGITVLHYHHIFYKICKARGIKILMMRPSYLAGKHIISNAIDTFDNQQHASSYHFNDITELQNFLKKYNATVQAKTHLSKYQRSKLDYLKAALYFLFSSNSNIKTHYTYYGRSKFAVLKSMVIYELKTRYRKYFIDKNLSHDLEDKKPSIYLPLHIEQERSLLIAAPFYTNQLEMIKNIAKSLPVGYILYVKEHPVQILRGWRPISDYKQIMNLPNVRLIHPSIKSDDVIKKSSLTISIGGTACVEAAFHNKPSIIFTDQDYSILPSVHKINTISELPNAIKTSLKKEVHMSDLNNYINLVVANSFELDTFYLSAIFDNYFHFSGFLVDVEIPIEKMKFYLEQTEQAMEKLATECVKKIQQHEHSTSTL
jgi:hypothetical protein